MDLPELKAVLLHGSGSKWHRQAGTDAKSATTVVDARVDGAAGKGATHSTLVLHTRMF